MNERIKELRKTLGFTQEQFGTKLGLKRQTVAAYEINKIEPSTAIILSICREFNVSEEWLRTGNGEMFIELSEEEEIAIWAAEVLKDKPESFRRRVIKMLISIPPEDWEKIAEYAKILFEEEKKETE